MARPHLPMPYDSFLPSGAFASPPMFSPGDLSNGGVRGAGGSHGPDYSARRMSPPSAKLPYSRSSSSQGRPSRPISPPKTRSASAEDKTASMIEDWRAYTKKIREQAEGERRHMAQDRERIQEVQSEERELWEKERTTLFATISEQKIRINELQLELEKAKMGQTGGSMLANGNGEFRKRMTLSTLGSDGSTGGRERSQGHGQAPVGLIAYAPGSRATTVTGSVVGSAGSWVPQESGRDENGVCFYAPSASNPSRTFEDPTNDNLRVDTISVPRESPIRATSSELTSSDFGGPPSTGSELNSIPETPLETVDISRVHPGLEGIPIKASVLDPMFVATVLSPSANSPVGFSPNGAPPRPASDKENRAPMSRESSGERVKAIELALHPEDKRLTMNAGHTPNHSVTNFPVFTEAGTGSATPTLEANTQASHLRNNTEANEISEALDGDKVLSGPLTLTNLPAKDEFFLNELDAKLAKVEKENSRENSDDEASDHEPKTPSVSNATSPNMSTTVDEIVGGIEEDVAGPPLRMKSSTNFGAPFGKVAHW
ncbi:hypothetical protein BJ878DRAFT_481838 [Calycina marina]|uniref:Uncharacterized protein n=1 Tax=Calycina marina TaxID=1763456 RepID=A0A9P7YZM7_9HELO|nr:hypothetical protein BJ878DRAFT_481838 [Calycina marina]